MKLIEVEERMLRYKALKVYYFLEYGAYVVWPSYGGGKYEVTLMASGARRGGEYRPTPVLVSVPVPVEEETGSQIR